MTDESDYNDGLHAISPEEEAIISPLSAVSAPTGLHVLPRMPNVKRVDSFTCSCSSAGDETYADGGMTSEPPSRSCLSVDMFSHFATAYTYPIDGGSNSDSDSSSVCSSKFEQSGRSQSGIIGEIFLDEEKSYTQGSPLPATKESFDSKLKTGDDDKLKEDSHRDYRRINSVPISLNTIGATTETPKRQVICSNSYPDDGCASGRHALVTPSPPQKKPASHMRSRSMPIADLSNIYDMSVPARASSFGLELSTKPQSHRQIVSTHTPLGDIMKLNGYTSVTSSNAPCGPRRRAGLPPRPIIAGSGRTSPVITSSLTCETPSPSHRRVHSAPGSVASVTEGNRHATPLLHNKPTALRLHARASSYDSFRAIRDASETLYNLQNSSPDPKLLGQRRRRKQRQHQRGHSPDSRTTQSTDDSKLDFINTNKSSPLEELEEEGSDDAGEQCWNAYYEKRKLKKNVVKNELKYRLSKAIPKALTARKSLSASSPELRPARSAKFC